MQELSQSIHIWVSANVHPTDMFAEVEGQQNMILTRVLMNWKKYIQGQFFW